MVAAGSLDDAAASAVGVVAWQLIRAGRLDDLEKAVRLHGTPGLCRRGGGVPDGHGIRRGPRVWSAHARSNLPARSLEQVFNF